VFTVLTGVITLNVSSLSTVLAIGGGLGSVSMCFIIPLIAYFCVSKTYHSDLILSMIAGGAIGVIGIISALHALINL